MEHQQAGKEKEAILKQAKKEASKSRSQSSAKDTQRIKLESELDKLQPSVIESSEAIAALTKRVAKDVKAVSKIEKEKIEHGQKLAELEREIQEYHEKEAALQKEYDQLKASESESGVGSMTEEQEIEYEKIRLQSIIFEKYSYQAQRKLDALELEAGRSGVTRDKRSKDKCG